ncbi:hypothetical protein GCM10023229_31970 [Flavisolibacter ginsenosidimutans]
MILIYRSFGKGKKADHEAEFLAKLEQQYKEALRSSDKHRALELGRNYYRYKRNGELTVYDEQALANDLATMK